MAIADSSGKLLWCNASFVKVAKAHAVAAGELVTTLLSEPGHTAFKSSKRKLDVEPDGEFWLLECATPSTRSAPVDAEVDTLTSVLSRRALLATLHQWHAGRESKPFALAFLDLNEFKRVNDEHGHVVGDTCLAEIGGRIVGATRAEDVVGRFGGDEFLVLLMGVTEPTQWEPVRERLVTNIGRPLTHAAGSVTIGVSIGVVYSTESFATPRDMISAADRAMYADKRGSSASEDPR